jgi:hypothetical protein
VGLPLVAPCEQAVPPATPINPIARTTVPHHGGR